MPDLAAKVRAKFPGQYDDLDDATLEQKVLAKHPEYADLAEPKSGGSVVDTLVNSLPTAGGMLGGLVGGASAGPMGAIGGAGVGGYLGQAGKNLINSARGKSAPSTPMDAIRSTVGQGVTQAGAEVVGQGAGAALKAGAGRLYQSVLKPTLAARNQFPDLVQTGLTKGVPVSVGGIEKSGRLLSKSVDAADALVANAASAPNAPRIDPRQAVGGITKAVEQVKDLPVARPQMQAIGDTARAYLNEHPQMIPLDKAQQSVRATDKFYNSAYRATMDRGNPITAGNTAAVVGINDATRGLLRNAVPGLQAQNADTRALMGIKDAIERRMGGLANNNVVGMRHGIAAGLGAATGAASGDSKTGLGTFAAAEALTNPALASRAAIYAYKAGLHPSVISNMTRAALLGLLQDSTEQP